RPARARPTSPAPPAAPRPRPRRPLPPPPARSYRSPAPRPAPYRELTTRHRIAGDDPVLGVEQVVPRGVEGIAVGQPRADPRVDQGVAREPVLREVRAVHPGDVLHPDPAGHPADAEPPAAVELMPGVRQRQLADIEVAVREVEL